MTTTVTDKLAYADAQGPDLKELIAEFARCRENSAYVSRLENADNIRHCRWPGKSYDGLKHQELNAREKVMPWNHCSDVEEPLADDLVNDLVDVLVPAFWNSRVRTEAGGATRLNIVQAGELRAVVTHLLHGGSRHRMVKAVEKTAQTMLHYGVCLVKPAWHKVRRLRKQQLSLEQIMALAQRAPQLAGLPEAILDPTQEDALVPLLQQVFPHLQTARARRIIRELRETGQAEFPVPRIVEDGPCPEPLMPCRDVYWPPETTEMEHARVVFEARWLPLVDIEAMASLPDSGWNEDFVKACRVLTARASQGSQGITSDEAQVGYAAPGSFRRMYWSQQSANAGTAWSFGPGPSVTRANLIRLVWALTRQVDEDGAEGLWLTCFSPEISNGYAYHEEIWTANGEIPYISFQTEYAGERIVDARGVVERTQILQTELKWWRDQSRNRASIQLCPPIFGRVVMGMEEADLSPFAWNPVTSQQEVPQALSLPGGQAEMGLQISEALTHRAQDRMGVARVDGHPARAANRQARLALNWLNNWAEVIWHMTVRAYREWGPSGRLEEILGRPPTLTAEDVEQHRIVLWYDVRSLDSDWLLELVKVLNAFVKPMDQGGVTDWSKVVRMVFDYLDPALASEVTTDQQAAAQGVYDDVSLQLLKAFAGNAPKIVDASNDATGPMKLTFAMQQIGSNPRYQAALAPELAQELFGPSAGQMPLLGRAPDPIFSGHVESYVKNLRQAAVQQQNKGVGRTGGPQPQM